MPPDYKKSLQQVIQDAVSFLLFHTKQDASLFYFLDWTMSEFLASIDSLNKKVLERAYKNDQDALDKLLLATGGVEANWKDIHDAALLHRAAANGQEALVRLLLEESLKG